MQIALQQVQAWHTEIMQNTHTVLHINLAKSLRTVQYMQYIVNIWYKI